MSVFDSHIRINRNRMDISTSTGIAGVCEHLVISCGDLGEIAKSALWETMFRQLHISEQIIVGFLFTPSHCKNTGNQILADAIFTSRQVMFNDGVATGDTWLVMLHKPGS